MGEKEYNGQLSLRIDPKLHQAIAEAAEAQHRSVNKFISMVMEISLKRLSSDDDSLENRNFVGRVITADKFIKDSDLVDMDGNYYRYHIEDNRNLVKNNNYAVIEAVGNILILKKI